jgi:hypothetical protein
VERLRLEGDRSFPFKYLKEWLKDEELDFLSIASKGQTRAKE